MKPRRSVTALSIAIFFLLALSGPASAASTVGLDDVKSGELLFRTAKDGAYETAPVLASDVHIEIAGIVARSRVTQIFGNPTDHWMEAVYVFPLAENAAVDGLHMVIGERIVEGRIAETAEAKKVYEQAKDEGKKAAFVEQQRPNLFTAAVANIGPGEEVEIVLDVQQVVAVANGRFSLRFPMVALPRYQPAGAVDGALLEAPVRAAGKRLVNPFVFHVDLYPGVPLGKVESASHAVQVTEKAGPFYTVDLARGAASADRDFLLEWEPAAGLVPRAALYTQEVAGERYLLLMVVPPSPEGTTPGKRGKPESPETRGTSEIGRLPRETIFVIDTSGSMEGTSIDQAKAALLQGLANLSPEDRFNVIEFNSTTRALYEASAAADPAHLAAARQFVGRLAAGGGTEMLPALKLALQDDGERPGEVRQVIFATDGIVSNEDELFAYIREHLGRSRLFTVGIGAAPNSHFMQKAAEYGRGTFTAIARVEELKTKVDTLLGQIDAPVLADVVVAWDDPTAEAWPKRIPDLYVGEPLVIAARLADIAGRVRISGRRGGGEEWHLELPLGGAAPGKGIDKLWARRKVDALTDSLAEATAGASPGGGQQTTEDVRRAIADLGLRHGLVTAYTSLVAVDVVPSAPAGTAPVRSLVPVAAGGSADAGAQVSDCIVVTTESPILDERKIAVSSTLSQTELQKIPVARDPWSILALMPGVLTDRINVGGDTVGQTQTYVGPGAAGDQSVVQIDGFEVAAGMTAGSAGASAVGLEAVALEEVQLMTAGAEAATGTPGVQLNLVTRRGTNEWRGSALAERTGGGSRAETGDVGDVGAGGAGGLPADRLRSASHLGTEWGGPLAKDHAWIWGALSRKADDRTALGGQGDETRVTGGAGKLNAQFSSNNAATLFWHRAADAESARGAGPERAPEATSKHDGESRVWKAEDTWILSPNLYVTGILGGVDTAATDRPRGGLGSDIAIDSAGVAHGSAFRFADDRRTRSAGGLGSWFKNTGPVAHEVRFGGTWRTEDVSARQSAPGLGLVVVAGQTLGLPAGTALLGAYRDGDLAAAFHSGSLWLDDTLATGPAAVHLGLRGDSQELLAPSVRFRDLVPRLGATWALGLERKTLLRASAGRYASRLGEEIAGQVSPGIPAVAWSFFEDRNGDLALDGSEAATIRPWFLQGFHPAVSHGLRAETTDELTAGVEHALLPEFVVGLRATWRRIGHLFESRLLVRDAATGEVFAATTPDWVPAGVLSGTLPGGRAYAVPYYDLRSGLSPTGGTLLVNGDRRQEYRGLTLDWNRRLSNRWMSHGSLTWRDWRWELGPSFRRYDDPTNTLGSGDDDGQPVAPAADPLAPLSRFGRSGIYLNSRWTFHADGLFQFPGGFELAGAVNGRQGFPLPWFRQVARPNAGLASVQLTDRFDAARSGSLVTLDARLAREVDFHRDLSVEVSLEALNLLSAGTVLARDLDLGTTRAGAANEILAPRTFRLGVRMGWR
jgi:Ca-activated chloride channel family protein